MNELRWTWVDTVMALLLVVVWAVSLWCAVDAWRVGEPLLAGWLFASAVYAAWTFRKPVQWWRRTHP